MPDIGHQETDAIIEQLERRLTREYTQAERELAEKLNDYFRRFQIKDEIWRQKAVGLDKNSDEYLKWQSDYKAWRVAQLTAGARWEAMRDTIAQDLHNANVNARAIITGEMPTVYALNHNFETYQIEKAGKVNTSYTLYNRDAVERLAKDDPDLLKPPGVRKNAEFDAFDKYKAGESVDLTPKQKKAFDKLIAENKDIRWQKGQIQSVTMQSILQGESIPNMARRIAKTLGETNRKQSIMYARTAMTSAQNAGRLNAQRRAEELGVNLKREWIATLDMRTRHAHRQLDGQIRGTDEPFEVDGEEIMFPGDPTASAYLIYNCRCTVGSKVDGWESKSGALRDDSAIDGMSYDEWKEGHSQSQDIESQEKTGEAMRRQTIEELYAKPPETRFSFTPASTIQEAEQYISQYVDKNQFGALGVSYTGISVDVANEVNRTIGRFYETFDVGKFGGIIAPAGNTKNGRLIENATAAYSDVRRSFLLNRKALKNMTTAEKALKAESDAVRNILEHPERYDLSRASAQIRRVIENSRESGRGTIPTTIEEAIHHELGHSLERNVKKHELWGQVQENMPKYNKKLSGYACEDASEYIAESFCSYMKGEGRVDPVLAKVFYSFRRK